MAYELNLAHSQIDVSFLISLTQVKQSANNESIVLRRKTVELEDSFFLNLMDGKQSREKANEERWLTENNRNYLKVAETMKWMLTHGDHQYLAFSIALFVWLG